MGGDQARDSMGEWKRREEIVLGLNTLTPLSRNQIHGALVIFDTLKCF